MLTVLFFSSFPITALADEEIMVTELSATGEITSDVNVRKGPGTDYEKIGTVRAGDTVTVTGQSHDGWYRIEFQGTEGFVYGQYMTIVSTVADPGNPENVQEQQADPEETEEDTHLGTGIFKTAAIVAIIAVIIVLAMNLVGSLLISALVISAEEGRPLIRFLPLTSIAPSPSYSATEPILIFISSAVTSPIRSS